MSQEKKNCISKLNKQQDCKTSLLDLPDVILDCILEQVSPLDLCRLARVCTHLRNRCRTDYLWEKHVQQKWGMLVGEVAQHQWEWQRTRLTKPKYSFLQRDFSTCCGNINGTCPFGGFHSYLENYGSLINLIKNCSQMALYICLETGRFWFPAQVFENMMIMFQCYDTLVSYDSRTGTFRGRLGYGHFHIYRLNIRLDKLRISPPKTYLRGYYNSNCLMDLKPGDSIEIQTRTRNDYPYGWRYGEVTHLESCDEDTDHCSCQNSDTVVLEFKQFLHGSQLKNLVLNRNMRKEFWDGSSLFGGIRKLNDEDIEKWNNIYLHG